MRRLLVFICVVGLLSLSPRPALAQTKEDQLQKEIDLLKREIEILKKENELLKRENEALKKGGGAAKVGDGEKESVTTVVVGKVEYVFQGISRDGDKVTVNVLATAKDGDQTAPHGSMTLVDPAGEKYTARPVGGGLKATTLKEGVPVKLAWSFNRRGGAPALGTPPPSEKITRFTGVTIYFVGSQGGNTIVFRNVPADAAKLKAQ